MIFHSSTPSIYSDDPDIVVLGDFNRFGAGFDSVKELHYDPNVWLAPNIPFFDPEFSTIKEVKKSHIQGKGIPNDNPQLLSTTVAKNTFVYDMILISRDVAEEFPPGNGVAQYGVDFGIIHYDEEDGFGFQPRANELSPNDLKEAHSDHRPLWMAFKTDTQTADDDPGGVVLNPPTEEGGFVGTEFGNRFHRPSCRTIQGRTLTSNWVRRAEAALERLPCGVFKP